MVYFHHILATGARISNPCVGVRVWSAGASPADTSQTQTSGECQPQRARAPALQTLATGARISNPCVGIGIRTDWKSVLLSIRHTHDEHEALIFRSPHMANRNVTERFADVRKTFKMTDSAERFAEVSKMIKTPKSADHFPEVRKMVKKTIAVHRGIGTSRRDESSVEKERKKVFASRTGCELMEGVFSTELRIPYGMHEYANVTMILYKSADHFPEVRKMIIMNATDHFADVRKMIRIGA